METIDHADEIAVAWPVLSVYLQPLTTARQHTQALKLAERLMDTVVENKAHPLAGFTALVVRRVQEYEDRKEPVQKSTPAQVVAFLMAQHGLKQRDLADCVAQPHLSAFLRGKRGLPVDAAKRIAARFGIGLELLLPT